MTPRARTGRTSERVSRPQKSAGARGQEPLVTIGLPVRNGSRFVAQAIESILCQTYGNLELVISDNASTDDTPTVIDWYARRDCRIRYNRLDSDVGMASNFNRLVGLARGPYFKWICHDDYISQTFVQRCVSELSSHPTAVTAVPTLSVVDEYGEDIRAIRHSTTFPTMGSSAVMRHRFVLGECLREQRVRGPRRLFESYVYGLHRTALLRKTRLLGNYVEGDLVLAAEIALRGDLLDVADVFCFLRFHEYGESSQIHYIANNWGAIQRLLDPSLDTRWGIRWSRFRRYYEHFAAVAQSDLSVSEKISALPTCAMPPVQRIASRVERTFTGCRGR